MRQPFTIPIGLLIFTSANLQATGNAATSTAYDGRWAIELVCPDTQDRSGTVKGYTYHFEALVLGGKLEGQYGTKGEPASVSFSGEVANDGGLEIDANGNTGQPDHSVGRLSRGKPYSYTMTGKLDETKGQAARNELRPCTASLRKL